MKTEAAHRGEGGTPPPPDKLGAQEERAPSIPLFLI